MFYEFKCTEHGVFTVELPISSESSKLHYQDCPECNIGSPRIYSRTAILFNSPGFYVTDYKASRPV